MLTIECATEACSLALFDGGRLLDARHEMLGRGHAEQLVPLIASLPDKGRADTIRVSLGPGSFTGVRIGLAAARALGLAWRAQVLGYPTLALVAAGSRDGAPVLVCMAGGHGEWFVQSFAGGRPTSSLGSFAPDEAVARHRASHVVGSRAEEFVALSGYGTAEQRLPEAAHALRLSPDLLTTTLVPLYGRAPDARLPA